jgi:hypothetical protein
MAERTKPEHLSAEERVILFAVAVGIDHAAIGFLAQSMQRMVIRGLIAAQRQCRQVHAHGGRSRFTAGGG